VKECKRGQRHLCRQVRPPSLPSQVHTWSEPPSPANEGFPELALEWWNGASSMSKQIRKPSLDLLPPERHGGGENPETHPCLPATPVFRRRRADHAGLANGVETGGGLTPLTERLMGAVAVRRLFTPTTRRIEQLADGLRQSDQAWLSPTTGGTHGSCQLDSLTVEPPLPVTAISRNVLYAARPRRAAWPTVVVPGR
jgi:hypothetical protein